MLITTVASFYYNISEMDINCDDPFSTLYLNFIKKNYNKIDKEGIFRFVKKETSG
jgi:hypothetical protein